MTKESTDTFALQLSDDFKCLNTCEFLSFSKCSSILVLRQREVSPIYVALQAQVNLYTTLDLLSMTSLSFVLKTSLILKLVQISFTSMGLQHFFLNRKDYDASILAIVKDTSKFKSLKDDPTRKRENHLQRTLRQLKKKGFINNVVYDKIYPIGSQPARIYGTPKMHKFKASDNIPSFRPIVSSIGTKKKSESFSVRKFSFLTYFVFKSNSRNRISFSKSSVYWTYQRGNNILPIENLKRQSVT